MLKGVVGGSFSCNDASCRFNCCFTAHQLAASTAVALLIVQTPLSPPRLERDVECASVHGELESQ